MQPAELSEPVAMLVVPASHGDGLEAPREQYAPGEHAMQAVDPKSGWNSPAAHASHAPLDTLSANAPGEHCACSAEPVGQKYPASQGRQSAVLVIAAIVSFARVPAGHGSGAAAPSRQ